MAVAGRRCLGALCTVILALLLPCAAFADSGEDHTVHWGYEADNGPDDWGSMKFEWRLCTEGRQQSPVDLANAAQIDLPAGVIHTPSGEQVELLNQAGVVSQLDNGHTIQVNARTGETMTVGDKKYTLLQFHLHAPSEHTVDGRYFAMEMHFVHQADDGELAVVGVLLDEGGHNPSIDLLWKHLPKTRGGETTVEILSEFPEHIFPNVGYGVYHYIGSLTTTPCSEGVKWYIRSLPTQLSRDQINAFTEYYDHNNRPIQPLNERELFLDENPDVTVY